MVIQQVKLFKTIESELPEMEKTINRWIHKNKVKVLSITGNIASAAGAGAGPMSSFSSADILIIVMYERETE
ncbi:hypothetical protein FF011L_44830 [Roseimaritima multifibrata]|uniref:Uncharacterized protein n=1 Tax=Roseimaritima multifibrata TaxID=1930274 RepID=A0A517MLC6_9BACT|nr:hypothetical protein [Roseimaritima multifibrata]QDS95683.1 hypothetical protein FF011L_44830 [Roseimaritima multifibrata]